MHGLMLDWKQFGSDQVLDFYLAEIKPLREFTQDIPVTTNFMQPDVGLDYWAYAPQVDVISWDSYPR
jgi:beta-galactosidase